MSTSLPVWTFCITGAWSRSMTTGSMRCSSRSRHMSVMTSRLVFLSSPSATWVLPWEISQFMVSLMSDGCP